ncbi:hypothetical protein [Streptomyces sp. enrichment culture]|uniref:hypothetical protein n=1 Tax=Streptomyces sp. enrichment culture TaxID=1795815 RepID=UPI003F5701F0
MFDGVVDELDAAAGFGGEHVPSVQGGGHPLRLDGSPLLGDADQGTGAKGEKGPPVGILQDHQDLPEGGASAAGAEVVRGV